MSGDPRVLATEIDDLDDPRLADYRDLRERNLAADGDRFVAESEPVVRRLLESALPIDSIVVAAPRWPALAEAVRARAPAPPVYLLPQRWLDRVAGFPIHRGCLAIGRRPAAPRLPLAARLVVALEDLVDVDNVGAIVRHAAAFGADGLLLSPRCADPYYRKAIRVAMGNTFALPIVRARTWPAELFETARALGAECVAAVLDADAEPLMALPAGPARVLVFGAEGPGLSAGARGAGARRVTIPMTGADSLNVATAAAIFLYHCTRVRPSIAPHPPAAG